MSCDINDNIGVVIEKKGCCLKPIKQNYLILKIKEGRNVKNCVR